TSCKIRSPIRLRKQDLPEKGQGRCVKFRVRRIVLAAGRFSGRVMPAVAPGRYCLGADTAKPSLARCDGQGIYRICSFESWAMSLLMLKTPQNQESCPLIRIGLKDCLSHPWAVPELVRAWPAKPDRG